ncbi:hypothetical protein AAHE18_02G132500 [Arachis hypogaea]
MDDLANPYFLHQVDGLGLVLVSQSITGDNYDSWSCSLELALSVKNKLGFVDGSLPHPSADNPQQVTLWTRSDNVVLSHIFNSLSKDIVGSVMRSRVVSEVWQDLRECFQQRNGPRIFQLRRNLMALSQGSDSISVYFTKLKSIWDELSAYRPIVQCRCGGLRSLQNFYDSQLLLMEPLPPINRKELCVKPLAYDPLAFAAKAEFKPKSTKKDRERPLCSHCGILGYTIDRCFRIHGFPPGYGKFKNKGPVKSVVNLASTNTNAPHLSLTISDPPMTQAHYQHLLSFLSSQVAQANAPTPIQIDAHASGTIGITLSALMGL